MAEKNKVDSKEAGLEIGLIIGRFFFDTEDLHYGLFKDGLEPKGINFRKSQEYHSDLIIENTREGTKTILDVGSGSGNLARKLLDLGYKVDCVSPSNYLSDEIEEKVGKEAEIFRCKYEELKTDKTYDQIQFSESFQYVPVEHALDQTFNMLNPGGHLLICDFFTKPADGDVPIGGGHRFPFFQEAISKTDFEQIVDIDITEDTAKTMTIMEDFVGKVAQPIGEISGKYFDSHYPKLMKLFRWKFRERYKKINKVYFSGHLNAETFMEYKTYRLMVFKKPG
ncbi:MAG: class I SAM-dependent methyltransferase [Candidatus Marinimicrobia bacterium]|jgi:SAM-dependent methyltransferase|nr:class I SAM-dependent methyltransferase [Candidatus Neomarinimicrobiota bacterium]